MRRSWVLGLLILAIGVIYLLAQMGVWHSGAVWFSGPVLWPLLIVAGGLFSGSSGRAKISGTSLFMVIYGILLSLKGTKQFAWLNHINGWSLFFGVAIILIGISFLLPKGYRFGWSPVIVIDNKGRKNRRHHGRTHDSYSHDQDTDEEVLRVDADVHDESSHGYSKYPRRTKRLLGELHVGQSPWVLHNLDLWNGLGDIRINLATAHIEDGTYTIDVSGWMGEIRILVPDDLAVIVEASVSLGDLNVFGESHSGSGCSTTIEDPQWAMARQRCLIRANLSLGDIKVVRV